MCTYKSSFKWMCTYKSSFKWIFFNIYNNNEEILNQNLFWIAIFQKFDENTMYNENTNE